MKLSEELVGKYADVFSTPNGRQVLADLREVLGADAVADSFDPYEMAYRKGMSDAFVYIKLMTEEGKETQK